MTTKDVDSIMIERWNILNESHQNMSVKDNLDTQTLFLFNLLFMTPTCQYSEMSVWILNCIYTIYKDRDEIYIDQRIDDYRSFSFIENLWISYPEPELNIRNLLR